MESLPIRDGCSHLGLQAVELFSECTDIITPVPPDYCLGSISHFIPRQRPRSRKRKIKQTTMCGQKKAWGSAEADSPGTHASKRPANEIMSAASAYMVMLAFFPFRKTSHPCTRVQGCIVKCFRSPSDSTLTQARGTGPAWLVQAWSKGPENSVGFLHVSEI